MHSPNIIISLTLSDEELVNPVRGYRFLIPACRLALEKSTDQPISVMAHRLTYQFLLPPLIASESFLW